jgi:hypothetical protein
MSAVGRRCPASSRCRRKQRRCPNNVRSCACRHSLINKSSHCHHVVVLSFGSRLVVGAGASSLSGISAGAAAAAPPFPDSPSLNDRDVLDAACSFGQKAVPPEDSEPVGEPSSAALLPVKCAGLPAQSGVLEMMDKARIVTLLGGLDAKHQRKAYEIIEKHQPMLLDGSDEVEIWVSLHRLPFLPVAQAV